MELIAFRFVPTGEGERGITADTHQGSEHYGGHNDATRQIKTRSLIQQVVLLADAVRQCKHHAKENASK